MSDLDSDGIYEGEVPEGYSNIIFCRMNPSATDNNWSNKWNQTADLTVPTNGDNCYAIAEGTWDKGGGTWSKITSNPGGSGSEGDDPATDITTSPVINADNSVTFYYKNTSATSVEVRADFNGWSGGDGYQMTKDDATGVWSCKVSGRSCGIHQYKFFVNGNEWITDPCNSLMADGNSAFTVSNPRAVDENKITVNIYYTRADGQYTVPNVDGDDTGVWNASVSVNNASATRKDFEEYTDDGAKLTMTVNGRETRSLKIKTRLSTASRECQKL